MKKKLIATLLTATMVTGVMSGCGSNAGGNTEASKNADGSTEVSI